MTWQKCHLPECQEPPGLITLPETNSQFAPLKIGLIAQKRKVVDSNHPVFQGLKSRLFSRRCIFFWFVRYGKSPWQIHLGDYFWTYFPSIELNKQIQGVKTRETFICHDEKSGSVGGEDPRSDRKLNKKSPQLYQGFPVFRQ